MIEACPGQCRGGERLLPRLPDRAGKPEHDYLFFLAAAFFFLAGAFFFLAAAFFFLAGAFFFLAAAFFFLAGAFFLAAAFFLATAFFFAGAFFAATFFFLAGAFFLAAAFFFFGLAADLFAALALRASISASPLTVTYVPAIFKTVMPFLATASFSLRTYIVNASTQCCLLGVVLTFSFGYQSLSQLLGRYVGLVNNRVSLCQFLFQRSYNHSIVVLDTARLVYA
jgi:hypothetical protein